MTTADRELAERVRTLRFHGSRDKVTYEEVGYNSRLDELQAAALRVMLPELEHWAAHRHLAGAWYEEDGPRRARRAAAAGARARARLAPLRRPPRARGRADRRARASAASRRAPTTARPFTASRRWRATRRGGVLPGTEEAARTHVALPISAAITREQVGEVIGAVRAAL